MSPWLITPGSKLTSRRVVMDGATAIANILKMEGVDFIGCIPSSPLIEAAAIAGIRPIVFRQERTGVHTADGFSRVNNGKRNGIFLMQSGPGVENSFGGVAQAYADSVPVLLFPASAARRRHGTDRVFSPSNSYESITKWAAQIDFADRVPELMRRAYTQLRSGKPGPVLLEIPQDVAAAEISEEAFDYEPPGTIRTAADPEAVARAARALLSAQRPVIHAGQGVLYAEATEELMQLAEFLQIPVMTTLEGKSAFPENHPLSLGVGGSSQTGAVHRFLTSADLVFGVGVSFMKSNFTVPIPAGKTLIHATNSERDINQEYKSQYPVVVDAKLVLRQFLEELKQQAGASGRPTDQALIDEIRSANDEWLAQWMPKLTSEETPINPFRVTWELSQLVNPDETVVLHDAGSVRGSICQHYTATVPHSFIGYGVQSSMGWSLGAAMGAKMAAPEKLVIAVTGDEAFGETGFDLETAAANDIPILVVLKNNRAHGSDPERSAVRAAKIRPVGDYAAMARALGVRATRVEDPEALGETL
ncbi:MAG: thiamine pyrophosphate-requiring protein, partial [Dehalococcoidia bacterium]